MSFIIDWERESRTGTAEAVLCDGKLIEDIDAIVAHARGRRLLLTRLTKEQFGALSAENRAALQYDALSRTAILGRVAPATLPTVAIVSAGTADRPIAAEAARTLAFAGHSASMITDVGVAGLWRLTARVDEIAAHPVVIAVAGMEGALFSVLAGLIDAPIIALPTARGYGVAEGGKAALSSALASCAPGLVTVNIDNGFGAACAAIRILRRSSASG